MLLVSRLRQDDEAKPYMDVYAAAEVSLLQALQPNRVQNPPEEGEKPLQGAVDW